MKRRVFVAIPLLPDLRSKIAETIAQWRWLPIRWIPPENWHITLVPPLYLEDAEIAELETELKRQKHAPFPVLFSRVILAPPGDTARMIWLEGDMTPEFDKLAEKLRSLPFYRGRLAADNMRKPALHVTLARFEPGVLSELERKTRVLADVRFGFSVTELAVIESFPGRAGSRYDILASVPFAD